MFILSTGSASLPDAGCGAAEAGAGPAESLRADLKIGQLNV